MGLPVGMAVAAVFPTREAVGASPSGFEEVQLASSDGIALAGWYQPGSNCAAVILLHGAGGSWEDLRPYANLLAKHGYGVLALDLRRHGGSCSSPGEPTTLKWILMNCSRLCSANGLSCGWRPRHPTRVRWQNGDKSTSGE
jgi:alpha-beta hydrolase superfamily lysophospholipase